MESLVLLYHHLSVAEAVGQDDTQAKINPLRISPAMRTKLRTRLKRLESTTSARTPNSPYARALDDIRAVAFPGQYETPRGSAAINQLVGRGRYFYWWACEEKRRDDVDTRPLTPCDVGSRDELRVCARVSPTSFPFLTTRPDERSLLPLAAVPLGPLLLRESVIDLCPAQPTHSADLSESTLITVSPFSSLVQDTRRNTGMRTSSSALRRRGRAGR